MAYISGTITNIYIIIIIINVTYTAQIEIKCRKCASAQLKMILTLCVAGIKVLTIRGYHILLTCCTITVTNFLTL